MGPALSAVRERVFTYGTRDRCIGMTIALPFGRFWSRLAPTSRAALWMLFGGFCAVMMNVLVRLAAQRMHPFEVTFFRCLFSLFLMLPFIIQAGPSLFVQLRR